MVERRTTGPISIEREWFIDSKQGNIKDEYYFEKKLGSGGYGAVYLAKHKKTGKKSSLSKALPSSKEVLRTDSLRGRCENLGTSIFLERCMTHGYRCEGCS
jgi:hypothetical protein